MIAFRGVHFMAETASILCRERTALLPDLAAGCTLADSIVADQLRHWKSTHADAIAVSYVNTSAEVKAESDYCCTSSNTVQVVEHAWREHRADTEILFGPGMFLGAWVEPKTGRNLHVWAGACHLGHRRRSSHPSSGRPPDPPRVRRRGWRRRADRLGRDRPESGPDPIDRWDAQIRRAAHAAAR